MHRSFIIPDIHGCLKTLKSLLSTLEPTKQDKLIFLGDYVSKGSHPLQTLHFIDSLKSKHKVVSLLGNHDYALLQFLKNPKFIEESIIRVNGNEHFIGLDPIEKQWVISFLESLDLFYESEKFICVHAGFDFKKPSPYRDIESMINIRQFKYHSENAHGKKIIHGHVPTSLDLIKQRIKEGADILPIDNGCVYNTIQGLGNLVSLNSDSMELVVQRNIETD